MSLKPVDPNNTGAPENPLTWTPRELLRNLSNLPVRGTLVIAKMNDGQWQAMANGLSPEETAYAVALVTVLQNQSISLNLHNNKPQPPQGPTHENPAS